MQKLAVALMLAFTMSAATTALAESSQPAAPAVDPAWKAPEVIAFIGVKNGDKIADVIAGRLTASLAEAHPEGLSMLKSLAAKSPNVIVSANPIASPLPTGLNAVFIRQNYHDLYDKFMGPTDVPAFNKAVFTALKPGGVYVVLDHVAAAGSGIGATETLHRIDPARVKADALAVGFKLDAESSILANKSDDHSKGVFDPSVRGHTDQFLIRFKKPK
jgi:predicted methyltransferase